MVKPSPILNSAALWLQSLWLGICLSFFYRQFASLSFTLNLTTTAWMVGAGLVLFAVVGILIRLNNQTATSFWLVSAGILTAFIGFSSFLSLTHPAIFWLLLPFGIMACCSILAGTYAEKASVTLSKLCNGILLVGIALAANLIASSLFANLWERWLYPGSVVVLFVAATLVLLSRAPIAPLPRTNTPTGKPASVFLGPFLFIFWLSVSFQNLLSETWIYGFHNSTLNHLLLTLAFALGAGFSYKGVERFGTYRHLCQAALSTLLLSFALALPQNLASWVAIALLIAYLSGTMTVGLLHFQTRSFCSGSPLSKVVMFMAVVVLGFLLGIGSYAFFLQTGGIWILSGILFLALILLQHYLLRDPATGEESAITTQDSKNWALQASQVYGEGRHTLVSRGLRRCARIIAEIFFGKIRIEGAQNLAIHKHVILAANHPNTFLDPLILTALSPARLHYWAKATLWRFPIFGSILDRLGAIPVFRHQDAQPDQPQPDNQLSIALAARKMNKGAWFLIFPEGGSHHGLSLKPLKTGTARVAFRALQENQWKDEIAIIPVGIDYLEPSLFRTDVTLRFGEPVVVNTFQELFEQDARKAVVQVTDEVSNGLKNLLPHLEEPELGVLVNQICDLYGDRLANIIDENDPTAARKAISDAVNHYQRMDPDTVLIFSERMRAYDQETARLSTPANHDPIPMKDLVRILIQMVSFVTYGIITNWMPYRFVRKVVQTLDPSPVWLGTAKLVWGSLIFGFYYLVTGLITYHLAGGLVAFLLVASFITSAFIALGSLDRFAFRIQQVQLVWQAFWTQDTNDDLEEMKVSLIQDLERFREAYAFYQALPLTTDIQE